METASRWDSPLLRALIAAALLAAGLLLALPSDSGSPESRHPVQAQPKVPPPAAP